MDKNILFEDIPRIFEQPRKNAGVKKLTGVQCRFRILKWSFPKIGVPLCIIHFSTIFHEINYPAIGVPGKPQIHPNPGSPLGHSAARAHLSQHPSEHPAFQISSCPPWEDAKTAGDRRGPQGTAGDRRAGTAASKGLALSNGCSTITSYSTGFHSHGATPTWIIMEHIRFKWMMQRGTTMT